MINQDLTANKWNIRHKFPPFARHFEKIHLTKQNIYDKICMIYSSGRSRGD